MANLKIGYNLLLPLPTAIVTASSQASTFPVKLVYDGDQLSAWRSTGITSEWILIDHGSPKTVKVIYIKSNVVAGDTTFTFKAGTTSACTDYSIALDKANKSYKEINQTYRYNKIEITKASGTYVEVGEVVLCQDLYECVKNYQVSFTTGQIAVFDVTTGMAGSLQASFRYAAAARGYEFLDIAAAQKDMFDEMLRVLEEHVIYDDMKSEPYYGRLTFGQPVNTFTTHYNMTVQFTEKK